MNKEVWKKTPRNDEELKPMTLIGVNSDPRGAQGICIDGDGNIVTLQIKHLTTKKENVNKTIYDLVKQEEERKYGKMEEESEAERIQREEALAAQQRKKPAKASKKKDDLEEISAEEFENDSKSVTYNHPHA